MAEVTIRTDIHKLVQHYPGKVVVVIESEMQRPEHPIRMKDADLAVMPVGRTDWLVIKDRSGAHLNKRYGSTSMEVSYGTH